MRRPNILLIMSDQEQQWTLLPDGLHRPGVERLLESGTGFLNHHVVTLPCGPSRSTIYTGQHTAHTGVHSNPSRARGVGMSSEIPTVGTMLREHGYYTAYKGKWHVSVIDEPAPFTGSTAAALEEFGFSEFTPDGDPVGVSWDGFRNDPAIASDAANWLTGHGGHKPADAPWFLAVNFVNPHDVMFFDPTGRMNLSGTSRVPRRPAPRASVYEREWDVELPNSFFQDDPMTKPAVQRDLGRFASTVLGEIPRDDERSWRNLRSYYYNCLRDLDRNVETVLNALVASGHDTDTVVVYTTDHGEAAGAHGYREKPTSVYREVVNVPLVISHPDAQGGVQTASLSSAVDLAPTILAVAGVPEDIRAERHPQLTGHDVSACLGNASATTGRDDAGVLLSMSRPVMKAPGADGWTNRTWLRGIVDGRWKLARYFCPDEVGNGTRWSDLVESSDLELYDTQNDTSEICNLAAEPDLRGVVENLADRLARLVQDEIGTPSLAPEAPRHAS